MKNAQGIVLSTLVFAVITAIFAVINVEPVQVNFLFTTTDTPLILVILISALLGGLIVGFVGIFRQFRLQRQVKQLQKQLDAIHSDEDQANQEAEKTANEPHKEDTNEMIKLQVNETNDHSEQREDLHNTK